jgi:hypothetical protein
MPGLSVILNLRSDAMGAALMSFDAPRSRVMAAALLRSDRRLCVLGRWELSMFTGAKPFGRG